MKFNILDMYSSAWKVHSRTKALASSKTPQKCAQTSKTQFLMYHIQSIINISIHFHVFQSSITSHILKSILKHKIMQHILSYHLVSSSHTHIYIYIYSYVYTLAIIKPLSRKYTLIIIQYLYLFFTNSHLVFSTFHLVSAFI